MSDLLDLFKTGETFATTEGMTTWDKLPTLRLWRINDDGTPIEITKENTK